MLTSLAVNLAHFTEAALVAINEKLHVDRSAKIDSVVILLDFCWQWFASYLEKQSSQVT